MRVATKCVAWLCAVALAGCAATPYGIARGEAVAFVHEPLPYHEKLQVKVRNLAIAEDAAGAGKAGGFAGALVALSCGPWVLLCFGPAILIGSAGAAAVGAGIGALDGLSGEARGQLERRTLALPSGDEVRERLMDAIVERGKGHWIEARQADMVRTVKVRVDEVSLYGARAGRVGLMVRVYVTDRPLGGGDGTQKEIVYRSPESEMRLWLEDPEFVAKGFDDAYRSVAQMTFAHLAR